MNRISMGKMLKRWFLLIFLLGNFYCSWPGYLIIENPNQQTYYIALEGKFEQDRKFRLAYLKTGKDYSDIDSKDWVELPNDFQDLSKDKKKIIIKIPPYSAIEILVKGCCNGYNGEGAVFQKFSVLDSDKKLQLTSEEIFFTKIWTRVSSGLHLFRIPK
ncbi:MAG: hypothetical protein SFU98_14090 [Leptospiraceae bacterium]|nr:hypothetical protein [Leptospiraceae bacterium]